MYLVFCDAHRLINRIAEQIAHSTLLIDCIDIADGIVVRVINRDNERIQTKGAGGVSFLRYIHLRLRIIGKHFLGVILVQINHRVSLRCLPPNRVAQLQFRIGQIYLRQ